MLNDSQACKIFLDNLYLTLFKRVLHRVENNEYDKYEQEKSCCFYPASLIFRDNKFSTNSTITFFFLTFLFHFFLFIKFEGSKGKVFGSKIQEHIFQWRNVKTEYLLSTRGSLFTLHKYCAGSYFKLSFLLLVLCWIQAMHMNLNILISDKLLQ